MAFTKSTVSVTNITDLDDRPLISAVALKAKFDKYGSDDKTYVNSLIDELESSADGTSGSDSIGMTQLVNNGSATTTAQAQAEALDLAIGTRTYTEQNYVTNAQSITASIDALDQQLKDEVDASVKITGNQSIAGVKTFAFSPVAPTPTTDTQVAIKSYVDSQSPLTIPNDSLTELKMSAEMKKQAGGVAPYSLGVTPKQTGGGYLINGAFDVWQRGAGFDITTVSNVYCADRWFATLNQVTSGTLSVARNSTIKPVDNNYTLELNLTSLVSTSVVNLTQIIETLNVVPMRGKNVTIAVKMRVLSGSANIKMLVVDGTNSNGFPNTSTTQSLSEVSVGTDFTDFSFNHTVQSSANSLALRLEIPIGFTGVLYLAKCKLEIGSVATTFINKTFAEEFQDCQRYYFDLAGRYRMTNYSSNTLGFGISKELLNFMRTTPTIVITGLETTNWRVLTTAGTSQTGFNFSLPTSQVINAAKTSHGLTDAYMSIDKGFIFADAEI